MTEIPIRPKFCEYNRDKGWGECIEYLFPKLVEICDKHRADPTGEGMRNAILALAGETWINHLTRHD